MGGEASTTDERGELIDHNDYEFAMFRHDGHKTMFHRAHAKEANHEGMMFAYLFIRFHDKLSTS